MKKVLTTGLLAAAIAATGPFPASAGSRGCQALPADSIITSVLSTGLLPSSDPVLRWPYYVLRAVDPRGGEVRIVADAQLGDVVSILPTYRFGPFFPPYSAAPHIIHVPDDEQPAAAGHDQKSQK